MILPSHTTVAAALAAMLFHGSAMAQAAAPAPAVPAFDVAYRAWDAVTDIARHNRDAALSGECGRTFRPFVIPGLKMQDKQGQDAAAVACYAAARAACANSRLLRTADITKKCEEFR